jgi:hypothetical protein
MTGLPILASGQSDCQGSLRIKNPAEAGNTINPPKDLGLEEVFR